MLKKGRKAKRKERMLFFEVKIKQDRCRLMQLQVKRQQTAEITYLQANKQERRYRLTYSEISK